MIRQKLIAAAVENLPVVPYRCQPFDLDDKVLIQSAYKTGNPLHVYMAIQTAINGLRKHIQSLPPPPIIHGELAIHICKSTNYFDEFVIRAVIQEAANATGMGIALLRHPPPKNQKKPATPYVEFIQ